MIKKIDKLYTVYNGELIVDDLTKEEIKKVWTNFTRDKDTIDFF